MAPPKDKSVRFAESTSEAPAAAPSAKRSKQVDSDDGNNNKDNNHRPKKRPRVDRPNEDELDDVDDWVGEDEEEQIEGLPSEKEKLEAKRARRQRREAGGQVEGGDNNSDEEDAFESTNIDNTTSLANEGVTIEPFHMENEKRDGTGYFDGDTYIFRRRDADEEPDAWLESLGETKGQENAWDASEGSTDAGADDDSSPAGKLDNLSKEELYAKILLLVSDTETVMQALVRYGTLLKRKPLKHRNKHKESAATQNGNGAKEESDSMQSESFQMAQTALNELTETADALLSLGDVGIYEKTRNDVLKLLPSHEAEASMQPTSSNSIPETSEPSESGTVSWEYKGTQDGEIHGPYSTQQMKAWVQAGYFKGAQVRSVKRQTKSTMDDMLSDLMDDDDDAEGKESKTDEEFIRGEWETSDNLNFDAFQ